ncbi:hypothetical protein ACHAXT_000677 [Thalassiosira profunda]
MQGSGRPLHAPHSTPALTAGKKNRARYHLSAYQTFLAMVATSLLNLTFLLRSIHTPGSGRYGYAVSNEFTTAPQAVEANVVRGSPGVSKPRDNHVPIGVTAGSDSGNSPYTTAALEKNPHLGWQPLVRHDSPFSWRACFRNTTSDEATRPTGCLEHDLGEAPQVEKNWVPDVTMLHKMALYGRDINGNPFPPTMSAELCENIGETGEDDADANKEGLRASQISPIGAFKSTAVTIPSNSGHGDFITVPTPRVLCLVYTMADAHANRIRAIRETWAGGCDGFLAFSTESDPRLPAIALAHRGPESYDNMWQKVRAIWRFVGHHYSEDFDWYYIGGDDLFVLPSNLKAYLATLAHNEDADPNTTPYFVGRRYNHKKTGRWNGGGPGYALSRAALRQFLAVMDDEKICFSGETTSKEDVLISRCLRNLGIDYVDTRDDKGRERFHTRQPGWHYNWSPAQSFWPKLQLGWTILQGKDCCAPDSVSFHYVKQPSMMRHLQALLYGCDS